MVERYRAGFLYKEGGVRKNVKRRYFVADALGVVYYETEKEQAPLGSIPVADVLSAVDLGTHKQRPWCLQVVTPSRAWLLWAESGDSHAAWLLALERVARARLTPPAPALPAKLTPALLMERASASHKPLDPARTGIGTYQSIRLLRYSTRLVLAHGAARGLLEHER